jgi:hypothetical protein
MCSATILTQESCTAEDASKLRANAVYCNFAKIMSDCGFYYLVGKSAFEGCLVGKTGIATPCASCFYNDIGCTLGV